MCYMQTRTVIAHLASAEQCCKFLLLFMAGWVPADFGVAVSGSAVPTCSLGAVAPLSAVRVLHMRELYLQHQSGVS